MMIYFNVNYYTAWGQHLRITGSLPCLGEWDTAKALPMEYAGDGNWSLKLDLPKNAGQFEYRYLVCSENGEILAEEWTQNRSLNASEPGRDLILIDSWQDAPENATAYSSAFFKAWFAHAEDRVSLKRNNLIIKTLAAGIKSGERLAIIGNSEEIGEWDAAKAVPMNYRGSGCWSLGLDISRIAFPLEYKFCVLDAYNNIIRWENGGNRRLELSPISQKQVCIVSVPPFQSGFSGFRCAGTAIPVFSLRSSQSCGIGDFGDLKLIIDWLKATSQKILQILPVNDTTQTRTWSDSYPYNAISVFALNPIYLNLGKLGRLNNKERAQHFKNRAKELNELENIDYEQVLETKWQFFREIFAQEGLQTLKSKDFTDFFTRNSDWLLPYSAFCFLRDKNKTSDFSKWQKYSRFDRGEIEKLCSEKSKYYPEISLHYYLQFHLHRQLSEASEYARANGVALKGDVPIGVSHASADVWTEPELFNTDCQTGAPPDFFSPTGQNWGFPTYNWAEMQKNGYQWWKKRFEKMSEYFDAFRIDHILGFFRIWEIPEYSVEGLLGRFSPALAFSEEEIRSFGFDFQPETMLKPRIHRQFLKKLFGKYAEEVAENYLEKTDNEHYTLRQEFDSQKKIESHFRSGKQKSKSEKIKSGLFAVCNEVLFLHDLRNTKLYHPRIDADKSFIFKELSEEQQNVYSYLSWDFFYRRNNEFWKEQAFEKLKPLISVTKMLVCGEDLGMIPQTVPEVMNALQILGLEIERMPKQIDTEFVNLKQMNYLSVCSTSTHDLSPLRLWWKEDRDKTQRYYNEILGRKGEAPEDCTPGICRQILFNNLNNSAFLAIFPLQDWLALEPELCSRNETDERINIPSNPRHYWRYRMKTTIGSLIKNQSLNSNISGLVSDSGRKS
ncbi:MAG: 4-alpha-glucanotransferase [Dysgonamonadaceae bacterium]|jgi:4-alpha-glucanotransferase|nr:4-alpha-glucanotransferase [Dysgonamonadaceae bacterium]